MIEQMRARLATAADSDRLVVVAALAHAYAAAMEVAFAGHVCDELVLARSTLDVLQRDIRTRLQQMGVTVDLGA